MEEAKIAERINALDNLDEVVDWENVCYMPSWILSKRCSLTKGKIYDSLLSISFVQFVK